jgi:thiol-disulfide isomerase/thioredoxin
MTKRIHPIFIIFLGALLSLSFTTNAFSTAADCDEQVYIKPGEAFPQQPLVIPPDKADRDYLGLPQGNHFTVNDIKADLVLVEIMSMYCGACRRQAPYYNKLYALIESTPETKGKIKMIMVGVRDIQPDVEEFREAFEMPNPLIPDPEGEMHTAIGCSDTPFSIFVRTNPGGKAGVVVKTHLGVEEDYKKLFNEMKSLMKIDPKTFKGK